LLTAFKLYSPILHPQTLQIFPECDMRVICPVAYPLPIESTPIDLMCN
jgi:hypothetical protein